jgi:adenylate cyclase
MSWAASPLQQAGNPEEVLMGMQVQRLIGWVAQIGIREDDDQEIRVQKALLSIGLIGSYVYVLLLMIPLQLLAGVRGAIVPLLLQMVINTINLIFYAFLHRNHRIFVVLLAMTLFPIHFWAVVRLGGFLQSGGVTLWDFSLPLVFLIIFGVRRSILCFLVFLIVLFLSIAIVPSQVINIQSSLILFGSNLIPLLVLVFCILAYFVSQREIAYRMLANEEQQVENLLLNILPKEIVDILKAQPRTIAEHFDNASIMFADVVNFTPMSAQMTPTELVELLDEVFSHFDMLAEQYKLEKIKTIGDCYMVAAGVPRPRADHAQALARMALDMRNYVAEQDFGGRRLVFRIGLNSGPVVAGVIGRKKFIYDLWGDAVNTASRMESHSDGGVIQITRSTYELICDHFLCEARGTIHIKGKGDMEVWHIVGPYEAAV